jgi:uncharacterized protein (DUF58 family)
MTPPVPSSRLIGVGAGLAAASLGVLVVPGLWPVLLAANLAVALVAVVDLFITPRPAVLRAVRVAPDRMSVLREQLIALRVENTSSARLLVRVRESVPTALGGMEIEQSGLVPAGGESRWEYTVTPTARGKFAWGPLALRYRSLLGFWERTKEETAAGEVRVYPSLHLLERYHLLAKTDRLSVLGVRRVRHRGGSTEFESLREYATGDDARLIDWPATARRSRLIVRNQEAERHQSVLLLIDCGRLMNATEGGISKLDHAVNTALLLSHVALARGDRVGLCAFSAKVHGWLTPRGNLAQNRLIADALYDLRGDFTETDHGRCLKFIAARHQKRSLLVVLTDFVDATTAAGMVAHLSLAARRHVVLFVALKDAFLDRAAVGPADTDRAGFRKAAAVDLLRERREVLERIRHTGGFVVDADPAGVTPHILNRYLEVMLGGLL